MQCEICQNKEATIHLTEITDGVRTEMHLCEQCAQDQGVAVKTHIPINELLSGLLSVQPSESELAGLSAKDVVCPQCGYTMDDFREKAVLGCPTDYEVFDKSLEQLIKRAHDGKTTHCGKIPSRAPQDDRKRLEIAALRRQLDQAVKSEDYEQAAKLRDKIAELE